MSQHLIRGIINRVENASLAISGAAEKKLILMKVLSEIRSERKLEVPGSSFSSLPWLIPMSSIFTNAWLLICHSDSIQLKI